MSEPDPKTTDPATATPPKGEDAAKEKGGKGPPAAKKGALAKGDRVIYRATGVSSALRDVPAIVQQVRETQVLDLQVVWPGGRAPTMAYEVPPCAHDRHGHSWRR